MKEKCLEDLLNEKTIKDIIRARKNNSALGMDNLMNPIIKLERESTLTMFLELMKMVISADFCPTNVKQQEKSYSISEVILIPLTIGYPSQSGA
jgi:hypothetical protein